MKNMGGAVAAYRAHEGPKVLVKYEDLISDTIGVMRRIYLELDCRWTMRNWLASSENTRGRTYRRRKGAKESFIVGGPPVVGQKT